MFDTLAGVTEVPRNVRRLPRSLTRQQVTKQTTTIPAEPIPVLAWVIWEDGVEELVSALATAWTPRAVRVRFGPPPNEHEVWVWAGAVARA